MQRHTDVAVALLQVSCAESTEANTAKAVERIADAAKKGARIACLPELFRSRYFCQTEDNAHFKLAEAIPGPSTEALCAAAKAHNIALVAGLFEKRAQGVYHNSAVVIDADGKLLGTYRKMHIPDDPGYYEKFYFAPGDLGFRRFKTRDAGIGVLICWDQWYPEAARLTALAGAQIIFYPTAIGWLRSERSEAERMRDAWQTIQRSHAIANGVFVASVNRCGVEGDMEFWGSSFVASPFGEVLASAGRKEETLLVKCDLDEIANTRENWPFLRDRRIDAYAGITKRFLD